MGFGWRRIPSALAPPNEVPDDHSVSAVMRNRWTPPPITAFHSFGVMWNVVICIEIANSLLWAVQVGEIWEVYPSAAALPLQVSGGTAVEVRGQICGKKNGERLFKMKQNHSLSN